jgi:mannose-1-phosphate guanylyltransferase
VTKPWCVVLASREEPQWPRMAPQGRMAANQPTLKQCDPLTATLRRAATVTSLERIAAMIAAPADRWWQSSLNRLGMRNVFVQPEHQGTAYEVLLALLHLERRTSPTTPVLFLPADHIVDDEEVMTSSLATMVEWIGEEPGAVYLLGAVPQGPHDQLGYIVPWHDPMLLPSGVYEFVERPDVVQARKLINSGGLWNTFIFGGSIASLINLFLPRFEDAVAEFRAALQSESIEPDLVHAFNRLMPADFSRDLLARQIDNLKVLRLTHCGWWPLKSPTRRQDLLSAAASRREAHGNVREGLHKS